jgi:hypothetical protein
VIVPKTWSIIYFTESVTVIVYNDNISCHILLGEFDPGVWFFAISNHRFRVLCKPVVITNHELSGGIDTISTGEHIPSVRPKDWLMTRLGNKSVSVTLFRKTKERAYDLLSQEDIDLCFLSNAPKFSTHVTYIICHPYHSRRVYEKYYFFSHPLFVTEHVEWNFTYKLWVPTSLIGVSCVEWECAYRKRHPPDGTDSAQFPKKWEHSFNWLAARTFSTSRLFIRLCDLFFQHHLSLEADGRKSIASLQMYSYNRKNISFIL